MKEFIKKNRIFIVFLIFFLIVLIQHQFMYLYHDDYGYASLSYAYKVDGVEGHNLNISQIFDFLKGHYFTWGGRVLTFFWEICLISKGLWLFRLVQSLIITLIFFLIYKIAKKSFKKEVNELLLALCTVSCYGLFEIMLLRTGIFWASASVSYLFPILPFLIFVYFYQDSKEKIFSNTIKKIFFYIVMGISIFCATFSQEQVGFAALSYVIILFIYNIIRNKRVDKIDAIMCIISIVGFSILMLAPGNALRQQHPTSIDFYSKPLFERIGVGIQNLILGNFSAYTKLFNILFYAVVCYSSYNVVKNKKGINIVSKISLLSISCIIFITTIQQDGYFMWMYNLSNREIYKILLMIVFVIQLILMFYSVVVYLFNEEQYKIINILISAVCSIICMIVAPYFALRSSIVFEILCFIFYMYVIQKVYSDLKEKKYIIYILLPIIIMCLLNVVIITKGYYSNNKINKENDKILAEMSEKINSGEKVQKIKLKKLNNILYSGDQPYIDGNDYIIIYMREYYNIPVDVEIVYE